jgi:hypothetical protein
MKDSALGRIVRFTCGALLGVCAGFFLYAQLAPLTWAWTAIPTATAGAGLAAMIWGDAFWERVAPWLIGW